MYVSVANLILKLQTIHGGARIGVQTVDEAHYCFCAASELASSCAKHHIPPRLLLFSSQHGNRRKASIRIRCNTECGEDMALP
jgi:hypothetical protein